MAGKDLSALLAELGGDNPQNRAIAQGLQKQGINSTKDIGVKKVPVAGHFEGTDEAARYVPETTENAYFNKADGKEINPTRLGIYDVKSGGKTQGNIFFHLDADDKGNVSFRPQWSPRAHGFLRDNAVGKLIMTAGKIIPSPFQAGFVAAGAADALAHGKVMQAIAAAIPYGIQQLAGSTELLGKLAGNSDFVSTAKTAAGKIAEAAGAPASMADLVGKVAASGVTAGISGGDVGAAMLKAGAGSVLGESKEFLKSAGDFSKSGIGSLIPEGVNAESFDPKALEELGDSLEEFAPQDDGLASLPDTRADENGLGNDLMVDLNAPLELPPGAEPDEVAGEERYALNPDEATAEIKSKEVNPSNFKVPPIFPPSSVKDLNAFKPTETGGLEDIIKGLLGGAVVGKTIEGLTKSDEAPVSAPAGPLTGNYNFSWNPQQTKAPEGGIAYGQKYFGPHWNQKDSDNRLVAIPSPVNQNMQPIPNDANQINFAEGGLMSLDRTVELPNFQPTVSGAGIQATDELTSQAVQHLRRGGHVVDDKMHKEVSHLASKGEPVHHIVGFMNHRKRMAEGGITSTSLGSYSDGGHLLKGPGDGMSDDIPATIADKQPARLANEEFVIPADVVSHLGNGSSESGAKVLYEMMAKIRKARTGNPKQGKQIDPHKLMPKV